MKFVSEMFSFYLYPLIFDEVTPNKEHTASDHNTVDKGLQSSINYITIANVHYLPMFTCRNHTTNRN